MSLLAESVPLTPLLVGVIVFLVFPATLGFPVVGFVLAFAWAAIWGIIVVDNNSKRLRKNG